MAKRKTTVSIDEELLRAAKITAAREGKAEYVIFEEALRARLGLDLTDRIRARLSGMASSDDEAMDIAVRESKAARAIAVAAAGGRGPAARRTKQAKPKAKRRRA